jgi:hypothetical protein
MKVVDYDNKTVRSERELQIVSIRAAGCRLCSFLEVALTLLMALFVRKKYATKVSRLKLTRRLFKKETRYL